MKHIPLNSYYRQILFTFTSSLALLIPLSCAPADAWEDDSSPVSEQSPASAQNEQFFATAIGQDQPNAYHVKIHLPKTPEIKTFALYRSEPNSELIELPFSENQATDSNVHPGKTYSYLLKTTFDSDDSHELKTTITIPEDKVVPHQEPLKSLTVSGRLFLPEKTVLYTQGDNILIRAGQIVSPETTIQTFPTNSTASVATPGRHGGNISIAASSAIGALTINGNGENGGPGAQGTTGKDGSAGDPGRPGDFGENPYWDGPEQLVLAFHKITKNFRRGIDLKDEGLMRHMRELRNGDKKAAICTHPPEDGTPGQNGTDGSAGSDGASGGNSAEIKIQIDSAPQFALTTSASSGSGGIGGLGGPGGNGGSGGPAGRLDLLSICPPAKPGPAGSPGNPGRSGATGPNGKRFPPIIRIGGKLLN